MKEYIEREAAKNIFDPPLRDPQSLDFWEWLQSEIESIPAADVRPVVRGKWEIDTIYPSGVTRYYCSICGEKRYGHELPNFCPNCGADMREVKE